MRLTRLAAALFASTSLALLPAPGFALVAATKATATSFGIGTLSNGLTGQPMFLQGSTWQPLALYNDPRIVDAVQQGADIGTNTVLGTGTTAPRSMADVRGLDFVGFREMGAKGDTQSSYLVLSIAAGSKALSVNTAIFTASDVGRTVIVPGAGDGGAALVTTIAAVTNSKNVTIATNATTTVSSLTCNLTWGTDDTAAINAAFAKAKTLKVGNRLAATVIAAQGEYLTTGPTDLTGVTAIGLSVMGFGARIHSAATGAVAVDGLGSRWLRWQGLDIWGDQYATPKIGLQIGRAGPTANGSADNHHIGLSNFTGYFTQAPLHDNNVETSEFDTDHFLNSQPNAYAATLDGINHWNAASAFVTNSQPVDAQQSFNENLFLNCIFGEYGAGGIPIWVAGASRLRMVSSYAASFGTVAVQIYSVTGSTMIQPDFDLHIETASVTDAFLLSGTATAVSIPGLRFRDNAVFASNSLFKIDAGSSITSASLPSADIDVGQMATTGAKLFDVPAPWSISGRVTLPNAGNFNATIFSGELCIATTCTDYLSFPSPLNVPLIQPSGFLASLTFNPGMGSFYSVTNGSDYTPTVKISAPPAGGTPASASVTAHAVYGYPSGIGSGGAGYTNGDICNVTTVDGATVLATVQIAVSNGVVTSTAGKTTKPLGPTIPRGPLPLSGCTNAGGAGATTTGMNWTPSAFSIVPGSGFTAAPTVTAVGQNVTGGAVSVPLTAAIDNSFKVVGGNGLIQLTPAGTKLGIAGTGGAPTIAAGALVRSSTGSSSPTSGGTITAAANTDSYGVLGSSTLSSLTFKLPALTGIPGQDFTVDFVPAVTTLTVQTASGGAVGTTSASATTPKRFKSFDGSTWTMVQ